jgi:serine/threonine-protein kinase mTOR
MCMAKVNGIQGSFKSTSEMTMQVVRDNKDSLLAVLEAFVYDPLIIWRFMHVDSEMGQEGCESTCLSPSS